MRPFHRSQTPIPRAYAFAPANSLIALALLLICALTACSTDASDAAAQPSRQAVRGQVLHVEARSLIELEALEIQDENGAIWRFEGRGKAIPGFAPSHLNEHKLLGLSVEVAFYREGDALVLHDVTD